MIESSAPPHSSPSAEPTYRRNFPFFLIDGILFTLALNIIGPSTVVPDFIRSLTSSEILIGLAASLFDIGSGLPQLFIARYMVRFERKRWWFIGPNIPVRFAMVVFAAVVIALGKDQPQAILLAFFICYGVAAFGDGVVSVAWSDLVASSLSDRWRARLFGLIPAATAVIMLGVTPLIGVILSDAGPAYPNNYALIFGTAGTLFALSTLPGLLIRELPSGKAVERIASLGDYLPSLGRVLRADVPFRNMIIIRILTTLFTMAIPFYIGFATVDLGVSSTVAVPRLLMMQVIGGVTGSLFYTWLGSRDNLLYIRLALALSMLLPISALIAAVVGAWPLYVGFFISGFTLGNLFFAFFNWLLVYAHPDQRPIYVGLYSTIMSVISLITPLIGGTIAQQFGYLPLFVIALAVGLAALYGTLRHLDHPRPTTA
ncbi:MAG: MFS transporter [Phototrophicaceae bacterium]